VPGGLQVYFAAESPVRARLHCPHPEPVEGRTQIEPILDKQAACFGRLSLRKNFTAHVLLAAQLRASFGERSHG
jgi:hypothetical protein